MFTINKNKGIQQLIMLMKSMDYSKYKLQRLQEGTLMSSASTKVLHHQNQIKVDQLEKSQISFMNAGLEAQIKCYDWRSKTEFPIIKIYDYRIVKRDCLKTILSVRLENYPIRLNELKDLPLFKILYLLKESIIGFERLYDKFGPFLITSKMIALSHQNKCKIWLNQNYASNHFSQVEMTETEFLQSICRLFVQISNKLRNTVTFFKELFQFNSFCQALTFIQNYARQNKINMQNSCKIHQRELSIIENKSINNFDPSLTMSRSPKFLSSSNLRVSLKPASKINYLNLATSKMIKESQIQECGNTSQDYNNNNMKTSGDTAADIFASNTISTSNKMEKVQADSSLIFGTCEKDTNKFQMPVKFNKSDTRFSKFQRGFNSKEEIQQSYYSPKHSKKYDQSFLTNFKTEHRFSNKQADHQPQQNDFLLSQSVANVFNKNKWQKTLNGLFTQQKEEMKKSTHHGKEKRKDDISSFKLELLGSVGKNIHESFIHDDHQYPYTSEF